MNKRTTTNRTIVTSIAALVLVGASAAATYAGETCPTNGSGPDICVAFDGGTPVLNFDFTVDYTTDPSNPSVTLITGSLTWNVRSDDSGNPGDIGTISIDPSQSTDNFDVTISDNGGAGAVDVDGIDLTAASWTGFSNLSGTISGNLTGDLVLAKSSGGSGGTIDFTIQGDLLANMTVPHGAGLTIEGAFGNLGSEEFTITVDDIDGGDLSIEGRVRKSDIVVTDVIDDGNLDIGKRAEGFWSDITIGEMTATAELRLGYLESSVPQSHVNITINSDLPAGARLDLSNLNIVGNDIDFGAHDIDGTILIGQMNGDITANDLSGTIDIKFRFDNSGLIDLAGDIHGSGKILVNSDEDDEGTFRGDVDVAGAMLDSAAITMLDDGAGSGGDLESMGSITVHGSTGLASSARIDVEGDTDGPITIDGDLSGTIDLDGDLSADVTVDGANGMGSAGLISIGGNVTGDVDVASDSDRIDITGGLVDVGRVLVGGVAKDGITLGAAVCPSALIRVLGGLDGTGYIDIDPDTTVCNAVGPLEHGDIEIGNGGDIIFDPSAYILISDGGSPPGGDWTGDISVVGCFSEDPGDEIEICVCGTMEGTVTVSQPCAGQYDVPAAACNSHCD